MKKNQVWAIFLLAVVLIAGGVYYEQVLLTAPPSASQAEIASAPSACNVGFLVSAVAEDATGNVSYTCTADNAAEASSAPAACATHFIVNQVAESGAGVISYNCIQLSAGDITGLSQETASNPAACNAGNYVSAVAESSAGVVSYTCTADNPAEAASTPAACNANFFVSAVAESAAGVISYTCTQVSFTGLSNYPANCGAGEYVYGVGATLTCQDVVNVAFSSNANTCSDTTSGGTGHMMGFGLTYTTSAANFEHDLIVTLNWKLTAPTTVTVNTQWIFSYGTGTAPSCNAGKTGTQVGNTYEFLNPVTATTGAQTDYSLTVGILGLTASTAYWFDLNVIDSSTASWTYSLPQVTVHEN